MKNTSEKLDTLERILKRLGSAVVAYSGGVDSTFLLAKAIEVLGVDKVLAVTAESETYPRSERDQAKKIARILGSRHICIRSSEFAIKGFRNNPVNRCYYCKRELFTKLKRIARRSGMQAVIDGANEDDRTDHRFGMQAAKELGVHSPMAESGIGKSIIRKESKRMRLSTWSKPSFACLASRFPYNERIEVRALTRVDKAEDYLRSLGIKQVRVRIYRDMARIETYPSDIAKVLRLRKKITKTLKRMGFTYITIDLEGYRTGSMIASLRIDKRKSGV